MNIIYGRNHIEDCSNQIMQFLRDLEQKVLDFYLGTDFYYMVHIDRSLPIRFPIGLTYESILDGEFNEFGFLNTGKSLHLGGTNIADLIVERRLVPYNSGLSLSIKLDAYDDIKGVLLDKLKPNFKLGTIRKNNHSIIYDLRINKVTVDKVREAYETEIVLIAQRLNGIDKSRRNAVRDVDKVILETLTV